MYFLNPPCHPSVTVKLVVWMLCQQAVFFAQWQDSPGAQRHHLKGALRSSPGEVWKKPQGWVVVDSRGAVELWVLGALSVRPGVPALLCPTPSPKSFSFPAGLLALGGHSAHHRDCWFFPPRAPVVPAVHSEHDGRCADLPLAVHRVQKLQPLWHFRKRRKPPAAAAGFGRATWTTRAALPLQGYQERPAVACRKRGPFCGSFLGWRQAQSW